MTTTPTRHASPASSPVPPPRHGNPWLPTPRGVWLVARIELLRRRPSVKGWIFYSILLAGILGLGILVAVVSGDDKTSMPLELVLVLVLGAGMLVAPSLAATSINGDSSEGVLAPLQMTHLTAGDLAIGKLLASWAFAIAALATMTPFLVYAFSRSGWHADELLIVLAVILLVVLTSTAIGLAWSAIAARSVASVSLAHLTTGFLLLGTLLIFAFTTPLVSESSTITYRNVDWDKMTPEQQLALDNFYMTGEVGDLDVASLPCVEDSWESSVAHTERTAWMLLANPVVMIGETSPIVSYETWEEDGRAAPGLFATMHGLVSDARQGPSDYDLDQQGYDECEDLALQVSGVLPGTEEWPDDPWQEEQETNSVYPRAPWIGLGVQAFVLLGSMWIVIHRLRVPYKTLRAGTRVA